MLLLMLMGLSIASNVATVKASGPMPVGNPGEWVTPDDYPKAALRAGTEGVSGFVLTIGIDGQVLDCFITTSSGDSALDAVACEALRFRARFTPAHDSHGHSIASTYASAVRWELPAGDPLPLVPFSASLAFDVNAVGATSVCQIQGQLPQGANLDDLCHAILTKASFQPVRNKDGIAQPKHVVVHFSLDVSDRASEAPAGMGGQHLPPN